MIAAKLAVQDVDNCLDALLAERSQPPGLRPADADSGRQSITGERLELHDVDDLVGRCDRRRLLEAYWSSILRMTKKPPDRTRPMHGEARSLGLDAPITRRDFIGSTLLGSGAMLLGAAAPAFAQGLPTSAGMATAVSATTAAPTATSPRSSMRLTAFAMASTRRKSPPRRRSMRSMTWSSWVGDSPVSSPPMSSARHDPTGGAWFWKTTRCLVVRPSRTRCWSMASCSRAHRVPTTRSAASGQHLRACRRALGRNWHAAFV